jgi:hypothetical protein
MLRSGNSRGGLGHPRRYEIVHLEEATISRLRLKDLSYYWLVGSSKWEEALTYLAENLIL